MKLLADKHIYFLEELLPKEVELFYYDSELGIPNLTGMDAWLLRTVTKVNPKTLASVPRSLKYVGSASAGFDHVDIEYLSSLNIGFEHSPGCNANAVAEYVVTGIISWLEQQQLDLSEIKVGILGMGHTGGALAKLLGKIGVQYIGYDPPKSLRDPVFESCRIETLEECDILSLHVPYTRDTAHATHHLIPDILSLSSKNKLLINASRGGVINESYLLGNSNLNRLSKNKFSYIIDVWEGEPHPNPRVVDHSFLASPHIAGFSKQAKFEATRAVLARILNHFNLSCKQVPEEFVETKPTESFKPSSNNDPKEVDSFQTKTFSLNKLHGLHNYDYEIRKLGKLQNEMSRDAYGSSFQELRNKLPLRNEFRVTPLPEKIPKKYSPLFLSALKPE